jgi:hypothetical protein
MWRVLLALVVVAGAVSAQLTVVIAAPDPTFIAGLYDGGDLDVLIDLVSGQVPVIVKDCGVWRDAMPTVVAIARCPLHARAPPAPSPTD